MWPNPQETSDLVTFTEEILNRELHFLCIEITVNWKAIFQEIMLEILLMCLGFFKEFADSLIIQGIKRFSHSTTFFWFKPKLW